MNDFELEEQFVEELLCRADTTISSFREVCGDADINDLIGWPFSERAKIDVIHAIWADDLEGARPWIYDP
jgi:hypothetical protein